MSQSVTRSPIELFWTAKNEDGRQKDLTSCRAFSSDFSFSSCASNIKDPPKPHKQKGFFKKEEEVGFLKLIFFFKKEEGGVFELNIQL